MPVDFKLPAFLIVYFIDNQYLIHFSYQLKVLNQLFVPLGILTCPYKTTPRYGRQNPLLFVVA